MFSKIVPFICYYYFIYMRKILSISCIKATCFLFISGISSVDRKACGKIGLRAFSYYMVTTVIAAFTGIALAFLIQPGKSLRAASVSSSGKTEAVQTVDAFLDLIRCVLKSYRQHIIIQLAVKRSDHCF